METNVTEKAKQYLDKHDIYYQEKTNGLLIIEGVSYWSTKDKWRTNDGVTGMGLNTLIRKQLELI